MTTELVVIDRPSPNFGPRPHGTPIDILLLHYTDMLTAEAAIERLCDPAAQVSAHYVVDRDGTIVRLVDEAKRAWHAGVGHWAGAHDINSRSIGIEIVNRGHSHGPEREAYPNAQIEAVILLSKTICARYPILPERVLAHSDIAPARKQDPGDWFPWRRLAAQGVGLWVDPEPISDGAALKLGDRGETVSALQSDLSRFGYGISVDGNYGEETRFVVTAFQRHFRPARVDGIAESSTQITLQRLIQALPMERWLSGKPRIEA